VRIFYTMFFLGCSNIAFTQTNNNKSFDFNKQQQQMQLFMERRINTTFPDIDTLQTLSGSPFYFNKINKPTMVYIGFDGCAPCRFALPLFIKTANEIKYKDYNFVYLSYDNAATIYDELKQQKAQDLKAIKIVTIPHDLIDDDQLVIGYPTVYYVNAERKIKYVTMGGTTEGADKLRDEWHAKLDSLNTIK